MTRLVCTTETAPCSPPALLLIALPDLFIDGPWKQSVVARRTREGQRYVDYTAVSRLGDVAPGLGGSNNHPRSTHDRRNSSRRPDVDVAKRVRSVTFGTSSVQTWSTILRTAGPCAHWRASGSAPQSPESGEDQRVVMAFSRRYSPRSSSHMLPDAPTTDAT